MKMSPGAGFFFSKMRSEGGVRSGREWKCWTPLGLPPGSGIRCSLPELMNRAIVNVTAPLRAPTSGAPARTVTLSPGLNGFIRTKLAPCPSECDLSTPVWAPVFEPVTCTVPSELGGAPRKLTWVCGEATGVPAVGYTATGGVATPELLASTSAPLEATTMPAIADTARRFESTDHLSLDGDEKGGTIGETRETDLSCGRSTRPGFPATERRRNRTFPARGCPAVTVLKTGWATRPVPLRGRVYVWEPATRDWPRSALRIRQRRRRAGQLRGAGGSVLGERRGGRRLEGVHVLDEVQLRPRFEAGEPLEVLGAVELQ